jgi:hypothetical protein
MACEYYDDGTYYCETDWGYYGQDANGYFEGRWGDGGSGLDPNNAVNVAGDTLSNIFGHGWNNRGYQPQYGSANYYPGQQGFNASLNRQGAGFNISPTVLLIGAVVAGAFVFGKRGR